MNKKKIIYIASIITAITIIFSSIVFAKYYNNYNITASGKIAKPIINILIEDVKSGIITADTDAEMTLSVSNYEGDDISDVGQNYYIQFYSDNIDLSNLNINVTKDGSKIQVKNEATEKVYIPANKKEKHIYTVRISNNNNNDNINGNIKADVISEQVAPK